MNGHGAEQVSGSAGSGLREIFLTLRFVYDGTDEYEMSEYAVRIVWYSYFESSLCENTADGLDSVNLEKIVLMNLDIFIAVCVGGNCPDAHDRADECRLH